MTGAHVGHDCKLKNNIILVNSYSLAGHVEVVDFAIVGAYVAVKQYCRVGAHCFLTKGALITKDVTPYVTVAGNPPKVSGLNTTGLKRRGFSREFLSLVKQVYKCIFIDKLLFKEVVSSVEGLNSDGDLDYIIEFLKSSKTGVVK